MVTNQCDKAGHGMRLHQASQTLLSDIAAVIVPLGNDYENSHPM
jgi:hypothetical protein